MATRAYQAPPLDLALSVIPSLPRPLLSRLVIRAIERLDEMDGDADLEPDDFGGGNVEDEGEPDHEGGSAEHGIDQREVHHWGGTWKDA